MNRALLFLIVLAALFGVSLGDSSWLQSLRKRVGYGASSDIPVAKDGKTGGYGNAEDCVVGEWVTWGSCSRTCGTGSQQRTRRIVHPASNGGAPCPATSDSLECNTQSCSVDCVVGEWQNWGSCSATCGGGQQARTRTILTQPSYGGAACPATTDSKDCNTQSCAVNCEVGNWEEWSQCSLTCGGGQMTRSRPIVTQPSNGGTECPATTDTKSCNSKPCAVNCVVGEWQTWGSCSKTCGGGKQTRTRAILTPASYGGTACPATSDKQACNTQPCAVNCKVGDWTRWSSCSKECGGGDKTRTRRIVTQPAYGGTACPETSESQPCNTQPCAVNCVMGEWTEFSSCSKECGGGDKTRTREILTQPAYGGTECSETSESQPCNTQPCAVNCVMGEWTEFGSCSKECGGGDKTRTREILTQPAYGGTECSETSESQPCNTQPCAVNCVMGEWTDFSPCSETCGCGHKRRTRPILTPPAYGGTACPATKESKKCNNVPCPVNCAVGEWTPFESCSVECGGGQKTRTRPVVTQPRHGGTECPETTESQPCNTQPCAVNCVVDEWTPFGECSKECGGGEKTRTRAILTQAAYGGTECPATSETQPCNTQPCAVNCEVGDWTDFGYCSKECGGGEQSRTRPIVTQPAYGGTECPPTTETQPCNTQPCAVNCVVGPWTPYGSCDKECGGGSKSRTRSISTPAAYGGTECPPTTDTQPCNTQPCAVNCVMGEWTDYDSCSKECGGGSKTRTRTILTQAAYGGTECQPTSETVPCNTQPCAVDCVVDEWASWGSACSASCGGGQSTRTRAILTPAAYGGNECPPTSETTPCNTQSCAVNCEVGEWTPYGQCSKECGGGQKTRTRSIVTQASNGGTECPATSESQPCNTQDCAVNCVMGEWQSWGPCSKTCGGGNTYRTRTTLTPASNGGDACGDTEDNVPCNTQACGGY